MKARWLTLGVALILCPLIADANGPIHTTTVARTSRENAINVLDYGAIPNDGIDDATAFNAAITAMGAGAAYGTTLIVPRGEWRLSSTVHVQRQMIIQGVNGSGWFAGTVLKPDKNVTALVVDRPTTSTDGQRGDWSSIRDIAIIYPSNAATEWAATTSYSLGALVVSKPLGNLSYYYTMEATTAGTSGGSEPDWDAVTPLGSNTFAEGATVTDGSVTWTLRIIAGIRLHSRASIEHVYINGCPGNGIHVQADSGWTPATNANNFKISDSLVSDGFLNGLYVQGSDVNAGYVIGLDSSGNRLWGVNDISFLGNTYVACHVAANGSGTGGGEATWYGGAYRFNNANARTVVTGCYSESGQPPSEGVGPGVVLGGLHGAGWSNDNTFAEDTTFTLYNPGSIYSSGIEFKDPRTSVNTTGVYTKIPGTGPYALAISSDTESGVGFTFGEGSSGAYPGFWVWRHSNLDANAFMAFSGEDSDYGPGFIYFPKGVLLGGQGGYQAIFETGDTKPTTSAWSLPLSHTGSLRVNGSVHNQAGQTGQGTFGWQNTGQGTPNALTIQTLRWPQWGHENLIAVTNGVGSPYALDWSEHAGALITNTGATAKVYVTMDTSDFSDDFRFSTIEFLVQDSDGMRVTAPGSITFRNHNLQTAGGGYLESTSIGSYLKIRVTGTAYNTPVFEVLEATGNWTDGTFTIPRSVVAVGNQSAGAFYTSRSGSYPALLAVGTSDDDTGTGMALQLVCDTTSPANGCLNMSVQAAPGSCIPGTYYTASGGHLKSCNSTNVFNEVSTTTTVTSSLTAHAGGGQGSALAVCDEGGTFVITTVATAGDSVVLPATPTVGQLCEIVNADGTDAMDLFPGSGDQLCVAGAGCLGSNTATSITATQRMRSCRAQTTAIWNCQ